MSYFAGCRGQRSIRCRTPPSAPASYFFAELKCCSFKAVLTRILYHGLNMAREERLGTVGDYHCQEKFLLLIETKLVMHLKTQRWSKPRWQESRIVSASPHADSSCACMKLVESLIGGVLEDTTLNFSTSLLSLRLSLSQSHQNV